jgi:Plasmid pRiA4b ORF-3-like protein
MKMPPILTLRIELLDIQPTIFRRVVVPANMRLTALHEVIQTVMGWEDYHLHEFDFDGVRYEPPGPKSELGDDETLSAVGVSLADALKDAAEFRYTYDFGDHWQHLITVEETAPTDQAMTPMCIDGANACPPEDVGGVPGFIDFVEAMSDPLHEEHADMLRWHGERFDPKRFNRGVVNRRLAKIKLQNA